MAKKLEVVAMEQEHSDACEDTCSCGGLASYMAATKDALGKLGSPDPAADISKRKDYVARARSAGLSPASAANMIYALDHGFSRRMMYPEAGESRAEDYVAV